MEQRNGAASSGCLSLEAPAEDDLRELDRRPDALDDADITLLFFALTALKGRAFS